MRDGIYTDDEEDVGIKVKAGLRSVLIRRRALLERSVPFRLEPEFWKEYGYAIPQEFL